MMTIIQVTAITCSFSDIKAAATDNNDHENYSNFKIHAHLSSRYSSCNACKIAVVTCITSWSLPMIASPGQRHQD